MGITFTNPFAGLGTTLKVADELDRGAYGLELNQEVFEVAKERLTDE